MNLNFRVAFRYNSSLCSRFMSSSSSEGNSSSKLSGKGKIPWDKRFPVKAKDIAAHKEGGSRKMMNLLPEKIVAPIGIVDKRTKKFIPVPEMVPEFVVPDLEGFELKPYVSYLSKEITQNKLTAKDVFNSVYAGDIEDAYREGKIRMEGGKIHLEDGTVLDKESGQRQLT